MNNKNEVVQNKILTIPNLLSAFRICLIPVFINLYCVKHNYPATAFILILSGFTDIADGFIARNFNMISNFGKVFDPIADKLTQVTMMICLITRFKLMILPLALLIIKEIFMSVTGLMVIHKKNVVMGAKWHGKAATVLLYITMIIHVIWYNIPSNISNILILGCVAMIGISLILYGKRNLKILKK